MQVYEGFDIRELCRQVSGATSPMFFPGLVNHWPVVEAARESAAAVDSYLRRFYREATVNAFYGPPEIDGRLFYNEDFSGLNFESSRQRLDTVLDSLAEHQYSENAPSFYVGATTIDACLPGFRAECDLPLAELDPLASIWIGNRTRVAPHYDLPGNVACVVAGRRRFTLFPPEQLANLYVGPIDFTPAGQAISLVDVNNPDLERYPRFAEAMEAAIVVDMEPGDALFVPGMWWHQVEGLESLNILVNYWWRATPQHMDPPMQALLYGLLALRGLPTGQREAWRLMFDHYIFGDQANIAHIPEQARGVLGETDELMARKLRAMLQRGLNR